MPAHEVFANLPVCSCAQTAKSKPSWLLGTWIVRPLVDIEGSQWALPDRVEMCATQKIEGLTAARGMM